MILRRYRPSYFTGFEEPADSVRVDSEEDLLAVPFVRQWVDEKFSHFDVCLDISMIFAVLLNGESWGVAQILDNQPDRRWSGVERALAAEVGRRHYLPGSGVVRVKGVA